MFFQDQPIFYSKVTMALICSEISNICQREFLFIKRGNMYKQMMKTIFKWDLR